MSATTAGPSELSATRPSLRISAPVTRTCGEYAGAQFGGPAYGGGHRRVGVDRTRVRVVEHGSVEAELRPAVRRFGRAQQFVRYGGCRQDARDALRVAARAEVQAPREAQQPGAGVVLQFLPEFAGLAGQADVEGIGVGAPVDA